MANEDGFILPVLMKLNSPGL